LPIAGVPPDPPDPVDRFADVTNERMKRAEYLVTEWLTKWWSEFEVDMVRLEGNNDPDVIGRDHTVNSSQDIDEWESDI